MVFPYVRLTRECLVENQVDEEFVEASKPKVVVRRLRGDNERSRGTRWDDGLIEYYGKPSER